MKKLLGVLCLLALMSSVAISQARPVAYGNNKAAGKYYTVRGIQLYCETYGSGRPLLLIHGNGGSISAFAKTIPYFAKEYKVIAVDSRAHGKSTDPQDSLSFEMMADDFAELLDVMHIDSADVLGWSDGGINAIVLAIRHPDKVKKLVSTGANLWPDSTGIVPKYWLDEQRRYETYKDSVRNTAAAKNDWKIFMLDWLQPNIPLAALHAIKSPSLIICGDHDVIPIEHTTLIYQNIPHAALWVLPSSGHGTLVEHADEFNKKADAFFSTLFKDHE